MSDAALGIIRQDLEWQSQQIATIYVKPLPQGLHPLLLCRH